MRVEGREDEGGRKPRVVVVLKSEEERSAPTSEPKLLQLPQCHVIECHRLFPGHSRAEKQAQLSRLNIDRMHICVLECVVSLAIDLMSGEVERGERSGYASWAR
jgi:hypothetical protein